MNDDINTKRTELANQMAAAGAAVLDFNGTAAALAAIPDTEPQQYVAAGTPENIAAILPATICPQRRQKHGERPSADDLEWGDAATSGDAPIDAKDAARYRWIRQFGFQAFDVIFDADGDLLTVDALDKALDSIPSLARIESAAAPAFKDAEELAAWLDSLHESSAGGTVSNRKWEPAQRAAAAIRAAAPAPSEYRKLTGELTLKELAAEFCAVAEMGGDVTLSASACRKLLHAMTTPPSAAPATASGDELPTIDTPEFAHLLCELFTASSGSPSNDARAALVAYIDAQARAAVCAATQEASPEGSTKPTADLPDENECWVHIYPSDLKRMERTETHATVFSVAVGRADEVSVPLYTAEQVQSLLATKPAAAAAAAAAAPEGWAVAPIIPTPEMLAAGREHAGEQSNVSAHLCWTNMIAAAPAASTPAAPQVPQGWVVHKEVDPHYGEAFSVHGPDGSVVVVRAAVPDPTETVLYRYLAASTTGAAQTAEQVRDQALEEAAVWLDFYDDKDCAMHPANRRVATPVADAQTMRNRAYSTDRAAPEMDVEAEHHLYEEALSYLMKNGLIESGFDLWLAARSAAQGAAPAPASGEVWGEAMSHAATYVEAHCVDGEQHAKAILTMRRPDFAAHGTQPESAPVSTEQAGDAPAAHLYEWFGEEGSRKKGDLIARTPSELGGNIDLYPHCWKRVGALVQVAPSPNNSPVGADKEPK